MTSLFKILIRLGILKNDLDYDLIRIAIVIIFLFFGYSKWFSYEALSLVPLISHGPFIFWLYPAFGIRGAGRFLGSSEWLFCALIFSGFWNKKLGVLGALGACFAFISTISIIPFLPDAWAKSAGGFPAMTDMVAFLMKDIGLLAMSVYLLRQDLIRALRQTTNLVPLAETRPTDAICGSAQLLIEPGAGGAGKYSFAPEHGGRRCADHILGSRNDTLP